ncbi:hypothetical protein [Bacillus sp. AG4(2022)]|uniref:hypothetical protein n=1 Tax=Bacillus sp. AG4(2022) TaxID=2962594 RepID=UPI002880C566|nr:hypothetical protein [Bacillus sp. AG4(2022)]MDT0161624.1 hypothetical protein [Bacillus sp. AG4(2022)]
MDIHTAFVDSKTELERLLERYNLNYSFKADREFIIYGKSKLYGSITELGFVYLEKESKRYNRRVHKWECKSMGAVDSYIRQHALEIPRNPPQGRYTKKVGIP